MPNALDENLHVTDEHCRQYIDPACGLYFPWFTKPFLDVLATWDLSKADIFEWGSGNSTLWFGNKCHSLVSIEDDLHFYESVKERIAEKNLKNIEYIHVPIPGKESHIDYAKIINRDFKKYDIIVIDGKLRNSCGANCKAH